MLVRAPRRPVGRRAIGSIARAASLALALALLLAPPAASAQVVEGRLLDSDTRRPIPGGVVTLMDTASAVAAASITDDEGRFLLRAPEPGRYWVIGRAIGYWPKADGVIELGEDGWMSVDFYLRPAPIEVPGLTARARGEGVVVDRFMRRDKEYLEWQGFYERQKMGFGDFITPEELERRQPLDAHALLRGIPNISAEGGGVRCTGPRGGGLAVYVDGVRRRNPPGLRIDGVDLKALAPIHAIAGVEVYRGAAQIPLQYGGTGLSCVMLVWTKS